MSNNKQSSIEWLVNWMSKNEYFIGNDLLKEIEQAKEMDIQQKIEISKNSYIAGYLDNQSKIDDSMNFPNDYINEIYGGKDEQQ
jgi:hypothetical protein